MRSLLPLRTIGLVAGLSGLVPGAPAAAQQTPSLSLTEVYELARTRNPMLHAAASAVRAAAAQEPSAGLPPDPQLQVGVMNASLPGLRTDMPGAMAPSIQVMQMVPLAGKLGLSSDIAKQGTAIRRAEAEEARWEIRARAAMAFYEIYAADRQVAVMRETVQLLQSYERVARAMYAAGEGRQSDVLRAGVEVARMEADIARMTAMRSAAAGRLNALLNLPADARIESVAFPDLPAHVPDRDTLLAWAEASRPMLEGGRLGIERAATRATLARRELWPDVTVGVQYGQRPSEMGVERMGSLMLGVSVPVFAGRRQLEMRRETEAMREMAAAELTDMRARVDARLAELVAELDRARKLIDLYRADVLPQANATVSSALSAYRVGSVDFMTLVDARMTVNQYEQELYALLAEYGRLVAELEMTLGRELPHVSAAITED